MQASRIKRAIENPSLALQYLQDQLLDRIYGPNEGIHVMDQDWDNLVILDACRYDVFAEVNHLPGDLRPVTSRGGATPEFIRENFADRTCYDTVFVSGNAQLGSRIDDIDVYKLIGLWGEADESEPDETDDNTLSTSIADPEPVVEATLDAHAQYPHKRLISHLLPPHTPYLVKDGEPLPPSSPYRTLTAAREGEVTAAELRAVYRENVEYVLSYVEELIEELDGKTVVTADHGELLGEGVPWYVRLLHARWGVGNWEYFDYGHYSRVHEPELVTVPWLEIEGGPRREIRTADHSEGHEMNESVIEEQLAALGYR